MKKITSLFCALMIMMSASAVGSNARSIEMKHRQHMLREAMIRNNGQLPTQVKAPQKKAETINLTIANKPYVSGNDYGTPQVYISMTAEENYGITIYINGITEMVNGQTYTYADMDSWSSVGNYNTYQYSGLSDAAITWSKDAEGLERFEGFVSDTLGNTYNFLYQEVPFAPTGDTIQVRYSRVGSFEFSSWNGYWTVNGYDNYGSGNPYSVYFALNTGSDSIIAGHWTEADYADPEYNHIYVDQEGKPSKDYKFLTADITIIDRNDSLLLYAYAMAEDGNVYDIYIYYSDPRPIYHQNIVANMTVDTTGMQWGSVSFKAANEEFEVSINAWIPDSVEDYHMTYDYGQCYPSIYNLKDSDYVQLFSGSITITKGENGDILTAKLLGWNNTEYELYLTEGKPEKTRDEVLIMENAGLYIYEDLHKFIIWGCNEDSSRVISIAVLSDAITGVYSIDSLDLYNSYLAYDMNEMGMVKDLFSFLDAELSVQYDAETGEAVLAGTILAQSNYHASDVPEFTLLIKAQPAHPHLDYDADNADFEAVYDGYEMAADFKQGLVLVQASNDSTMAAIMFVIAEGDTTLTAGTYTCSMKGEPMTVVTGAVQEGKVYPSFFGTTNAAGQVTNIWWPYAGTITVGEDGVIVVDALNSYDLPIKVTINPKKEEGVENVEATKEINKHLENGMLIIEKNGVKYNAIGNVIK